jgi:hypothetical protein
MTLTSPPDGALFDGSSKSDHYPVIEHHNMARPPAVRRRDEEDKP